MSPHPELLIGDAEGTAPGPEGAAADLPADSVTTQVADKVRDMIIQDELPTGRRISERELAERPGGATSQVKTAILGSSETFEIRMVRILNDAS